MNMETTRELLARLADLRPLCPDMRFGQMLMNLDFLSEDMFNHNLWDVEDEQLLTVIERFRQDLARREANVA
jgi:hypothetical protein